jgi:hypothetical protein
MRFLTTSQLSKLYFGGSRWYPNKRLRNLLDAGLVKVWVRSLSQENIYSVTRSGFGAVEHPNGECPKTKIPYGLDENLAHLLAINDVRTALAVTLPEAGAEIVSWRSDWELRAHGSEQIIPDGFFLINWHGIKEQAYALEVDNNTKSARRFLKKILAYASHKTTGKKIYGFSDPIILVAGSDPKWLERYRASVKQLRPGCRTWFASLEEIKATGATGAIWANGRENKRSLKELT